MTEVVLDRPIHAIDHPTGDSELDRSWGVAHIGSGIVHDVANRGTSVQVAIIDSGIDYTHPDLDANYVGSHDFVNNDTDPMDDNGHGTHVADTVAAQDDNAGVIGVAPEASLYGLKVLDASGSGSWSDVIAALQWAVDNGIQVTNNSYGSSLNPGRTVKAAFDNSAAAGVLHVAASGNSGNSKGKGNSVGYPARYESVIAVAATDQNDKRASFSSTGDTVELAAPGVGINSTKLGSGYVELNGTSMASPHVAGTAALVIAAGIADVPTQLQTTDDDKGDPGRDPLYGFSLVDADEAAGTPPPPPNDPPTVSINSPANGSTFDSGATILFEGTASDTEDGDLTASLAWTSSIDGAIGTGGSFSTTLSDGDHTITAEVTDSGGKTGSAPISIIVGTPPAMPNLSVTVTTDKASYVNKENVQITAKGMKLAADGTANNDSVAKFRYKVNSKRDGVETYTLDATAYKNGFNSGSGSTTFEVTKWPIADPVAAGETSTSDVPPVGALTATSLETWDTQIAFDIFGAEDSAATVDGVDTESPDNKNEVLFGDWSDPGVIAVTVVWDIFGGPPFFRELVEWDTLFDQVDFDWSTSGEAGKMDYQNIATHEFGHSTGMGHPDDSCTEETMSRFADEGETKKRDLNTGDIAGINALY